MNLTSEQIEKKIKDFKTKIKEFEIQIAKDEQRLSSKQEEENKIQTKLLELYPEIDLDNLKEEVQKIEAQLEAELLCYENELKSIQSTLTENQ